MSIKSLHHVLEEGSEEQIEDYYKNNKHLDMFFVGGPPTK